MIRWRVAHIANVSVWVAGVVIAAIQPQFGWFQCVVFGVFGVVMASGFAVLIEIAREQEGDDGI